MARNEPQGVLVGADRSRSRKVGETSAARGSARGGCLAGEGAQARVGEVGGEGAEVKQPGATEQQLMAIFGWRTIQEAERYTRAARRKKMAGDAMPLLRRTKD